MFGGNTFGTSTFGGTSFGTGFGATPSLGAFGSTTQTAPQPAGPIGTTIRFVPINATDTVQKTGANAGGPTQITTRHQNISAMKEYESKSVDELRFEDYTANRKVGQPQQPAFNSTPFSTMQPSTSQQSTIFGTPNQQPNSMQYIFGPKPGGFEVNNSNNLFSNSLNKPATTVSNSPFNLGNQFNSTAPSTNTQSAGFSLFNNTAQTNTTPFGSTSTVNNAFKPNLFNTPTSNTGSIFGNNTNANTSTFMTSTQNNVSTQNPFPSSIFANQTNNTNTLTSNNLFNTQPKPFELNNSSANTNIFSLNKTPTTNIFSQNKTGFEVNNTSNLFSNSLNKPATTVSNSPFNLGNQFNTTAPAISSASTGFSIFNNPTQTNNTLTNQTNATSAFKPSLFSTPTSNTGSIFSANTNANTSTFMPTAQNNVTTQNPFSTSLFSGQTNNTNTLTSNNLFNTQPKPPFEVNNTSSTNIFDSLNKSATNTLNNSIFQNQIPNNTQTSPQSPDLLLNRLKTLPYGETSLFINDNTSPNSSVGYLKFTTDPKTIYQYKMNAKTNVKLNTPTSAEKTRTNSILFDGLDDNTNDDLRCAIDVFVPKRSVKKLDLKPSSHLSEGDAEHWDGSTTPERTPRSSLNVRSSRQNLLDGETSTPVRHVRYADNTYPGGPGLTDDIVNATIASNSQSSSPSVSDLSSIYKSSHSRSSVGLQSNSSSSFASRGCVGARSCLSNSRPDYKIKPTLDQIERAYNMETDTCIVDSFLIERPNYGSILFENSLDVKGLNIDEIVHIRRKEVVVYPDDENKPPIGQGLNRPAIVTLHQVWPIDKSNNEVIKDIDRLNLMRYPEKVESATVEKGARFIEYRPETGSWVFAVKHFSKYGITDDDEEIVPTVISTIPSQVIQSTPLQQHNHSTQNIQVPQNNGLLLNRLKTTTFDETPAYMFCSRQDPKQSPSATFAKPIHESSFNQYKMSAKTNVKLNKPSPSQEKTRTNSVLAESFNDSNYSMKNAIDELFEDDELNEGNKSDFKRSLTVHGTKRLALQVSPNISTASYERPITFGACVPMQQKVREIRLKPDLYAAQNKQTRDIMSVCVAGAPKVRFFNGSRKFCYPHGDSVMIHELKLVSSSNGSLSEDIKTRFETFLENNSKLVALNTNPILAPYIETNDFIPDASKHDLLHALYGKLSARTPYAKQDERLNRVINWLANVNRTLPQPKNLYQLIIYHMSCDRYDLASKLALENNHPRLALLVATLNLNKDLMFEQLSSWRISYADRFIDSELLKIYVLLSGLTEWKLSNDETIYCLKGLNWSQQLSLLALHVTSFVSEPEKYGFHLLPMYMKRLDTNTNDVEYHILARHSPANILSAANDLAEEWFLLESLKSFGVIDCETECTNGFDIIHCNVASQLGQIDLRWACFVALHINNDEVRNQVLIRCLEQNQAQLKDKKESDSTLSVESWLIENLQLPREFIENAKALADKPTVVDRSEKMFKPS